ncbi:MAG: DUF3298 and DUF4163 domain-containing protein [Christiangramia sp.]
MKRILIAFISILLLNSCADEKKQTEKKDEKSLSFSTKNIEKRLKDCNPEEGKCTFISLTYPVAENADQAEEINKNIERFILNTVDYQDEREQEKPEELAENFIKNYIETAEEFPEYELPWEATINGKVSYRSPQIISIKFSTNMFTGGAHGYRSTNYLNFDPETGKNIKSQDLFNSDFIDFVEKDFREKQNIPADSNINSTGMFFENDEFHLPLNIGITEHEVILHYNAYEIAPYSAGSFVMTYPKAAVEQFIKIKEKNPQPES